jgi:protocatechuate 3,4-dioxygenase beta subunit
VSVGTSGGSRDAPVTREVTTNEDEALLISGYVLDHVGTAVGDAQIAIARNEARDFGADPDLLPMNPMPVATVASAPDGFFKYPVPPGRACDVTVAREGFARATRTGCRAGDILTIVLQQGASIEGRVSRAIDASSVAGARVRATRPADQAVLGAVVTDVEGAYIIKGLEPGSVVVEVFPVAESTPPLRPARLQGGDVVKLDFHVDYGATVQGRVIDDRTSLPVSGAEVGDGPAFERIVKSGADGSFVLTGLDLVAGIHARAPGYAGRAWPFSASMTGAPVDLRLEPARRIRGRVVDTTGAVVEGVDVAAAGRRGVKPAECTSATTGADGRFELDRASADVRHGLRLRKEGFGAIILDIPPDEHASSPYDVGDVRLDVGMTVAGVVVDESGLPMSGITLYLKGVNYDRHRLWPDGSAGVKIVEGFWDVRRTRSDHAGRFSITDLAPGDYRLGQYGRGKSKSELSVVVKAGQTTTDLRLVVPDAMVIAGRIERADGSAPRRRVVNAFEVGRRDRRVAGTIARADGAFELGGLKAGNYDIVARELDAEQELGSEGVAPSVAAGDRNVVIVLPATAK